MGIRRSAETAGWQVREIAHEARWSAREAAWSLEERLLWRGSDVARRHSTRALGPLRRGRRILAAVVRPLSAAARLLGRGAARLFEPPRRLIQTKLVWPLGDRLEDYGTAATTAVTTVVIVAAAAAALGGTRLAADRIPADSGSAPILADASPALDPASASSLSGVAPDFKQGSADSVAATKTAAAQAVSPAAPAAEAPAPAEVAWRFAQAFAQYEVGDADEKTAATFAAVADEPLAEALVDDPPRLPESAKVPEAEVLNVVLGEQEGKELEASVSLVRLQAASELRLTLRETDEGWQVAEVRG